VVGRLPEKLAAETSNTTSLNAELCQREEALTTGSSQ